MRRIEPLKASFYRTENGNEPVRDWLKSLERSEKKAIGEDIQTVQYGWPAGMRDLVKKIDSGLWEVRTELGTKIARVLFTFWQGEIVLLHGFIKKTQKISKEDLDLARSRMRDITRYKGGHK